MNLVERYLQTVARLLPKSRREDIIDELRINILAQMEDRAEEFGRPLTEDEQAEILRHHGNPTVVAGRYRPDNLGLAFGRQWIGPELFPIYKMVLILNMSITVLVLAIVLPLLRHYVDGAVTLSRAEAPLVAQFVIVTLIFIALDRNKASFLDKWDPRKLPVLKAPPEEGPTAKNIFGFVCLVVGSLWLLLTPRWPYLMLGPGAWFLPELGVNPMPGWIAYYIAIGVVICAQIVLQFLKIFRWLPHRKAKVGEAILACAGFLIAVSLLLRAPNYITSKYPEVTYWANLNFEICNVVWAAIAGWQAASAVIKLIRERHQMLPARQY